MRDVVIQQIHPAVQLVLVQPPNRELLGKLIGTDPALFIGQPNPSQPPACRRDPSLLPSRSRKPHQLTRLDRSPLRHPLTPLVPSSVPDEAAIPRVS
jgi:hypothetical protein